MKLALALTCIAGCAFFLWRIFWHAPVNDGGLVAAWTDPSQKGYSLMQHDEKLERVAAKLDDISETLEEIKSAVVEGDKLPGTKIDSVQHEVQRAADAIEEAVDPE